MNVQVVPNHEDPYAEKIASFFVKDFPKAITKSTPQLVDTLTEILVGSSQVRFGPRPTPEVLVAVRDVLRKSISSSSPIPALTAWGSRKTDFGRIDVADVSALKQLLCLNEAITEHYKPGLNMRMRIEDASGHYLFRDEGKKSREATDLYVCGLVRLMTILGLDFITPVLESSMFSEELFTREADAIVPLLMQYISDSDNFGINENLPSYKALREAGWTGLIPMEQREYYRQRYLSNYPEITEYGATVKMAEYFANSLIRYQFNAVGDDPAWNKQYIRTSFVPPVPGSPAELFKTTLFYRTMPSRFTRNHFSPWRAKGYLRIGDTVTPKLTSFKELPENLNYNTLNFKSESLIVEVQADYVMED